MNINKVFQTCPRASAELFCATFIYIFELSPSQSGTMNIFTELADKFMSQNGDCLANVCNKPCITLKTLPLADFGLWIALKSVDKFSGWMWNERDCYFLKS